METTIEGLCLCGCGFPAPIAKLIDNRRGAVRGRPRRYIFGHQSRGKVTPPETRLKISLALSGRSLSPEHRANLKIITGEDRPSWKGDDVGYSALHKWLYRHKVKTGKCSTCSHEGPTEWANISGVYLRDLDDFAEMCKACHKEFDNWLEKFLERGDRGNN